MPLIPFVDLMTEAESGRYAVGYFESWNLESLLAVADAAEATCSPVLLGFSGIYLPHPDRDRTDALATFAALGFEVCRGLNVPAALVFNESPHRDWVHEAIQLGFGLVMFSDENLSLSDQTDVVKQVTTEAHQASAAAEGETTALPGVGGDLKDVPPHARLTDVSTAQKFIEQTGVDAFAVNIGQMHFHGRREVRLDLDRLADLRASLDVPLVLHGASSVHLGDLQEAIQRGIRKINVGSALKQAYFEALRDACAAVEEPYNPYLVIGSGLSRDVLMAGRLALQRQVEDWMRLFGSAGRV
jgi:fructose/tagatose bisphosphate aldolase